MKRSLVLILAWLTLTEHFLLPYAALAAHQSHSNGSAHSPPHHAQQSASAKNSSADDQHPPPHFIEELPHHIEVEPNENELEEFDELNLVIFYLKSLFLTAYLNPLHAWHLPHHQTQYHLENFSISFLGWIASVNRCAIINFAIFNQY